MKRSCVRLCEYRICRCKLFIDHLLGVFGGGGGGGGGVHKYHSSHLFVSRPKRDEVGVVNTADISRQV